MAASILTAIADPNEEPQLGGVTMSDIWASIEEVQSIHPEWFKPGQGWGPQASKENNNATNNH